MLLSQPSPPPFRFERRPHELRFRVMTLEGREWLTPGYLRARFRGDLSGFASDGADDHLRLFLPAAPTDDVEQLRASPSREYTPLAWSIEDGWLDLEFAIHGDEGVAAPWAASAPLGSPVGIGGPRGSRAIVGAPDSWFLAGDETGVPAIRRFARSMARDATGSILIEVADNEHELAIEAPAGVRVEQLHRGSSPAGSALRARLDSLTAEDRPSGAVLAFVAAEQSLVKPARALLVDRWDLSPDDITVKGYWKRGTAEYHAPH